MRAYTNTATTTTTQKITEHTELITGTPKWVQGKQIIWQGNGIEIEAHTNRAGEQQRKALNGGIYVSPSK